MPGGAQRVMVVDSHTGGEPTRLVVAGGPSLGGGSVAQRLSLLRREHDTFRSALMNEPRGSDVLVGALLLPPEDPQALAGVIFFNNVGYLGMCGHGTIGLMATLAHLGWVKPGEHRLETCVGEVRATLEPDGLVRVANVPSHRKATVEVQAPGIGGVRGDVAWAGNWFFLVEAQEATPLPLRLEHVGELSRVGVQLRDAVWAAGFPEVDHVELFGPPVSAGARSRSFVLCPGGAYDRSPCGTGTSAKLACLAARGKLAEGEPWVQESIVGSTFTGVYRWVDRVQGIIEPTIAGRAYVTAEATLVIDPDDPFRHGITAAREPSHA